MTVVLVEHDMKLVMNVSHHVIVLDYGRKLAEGAPDEVRRNPEVIAAYLGAAKTAEREAMRALAVIEAEHRNMRRVANALGALGRAPGRRAEAPTICTPWR